MILEHGAEPEEIYAVTFTNKAAKEMKERVQSLLDCFHRPVFVSTFHSSCARLLRRHARALSYTADFAIYDAEDSLSALRRVYKKLGINPKLLDPRAARQAIDRAKNDYLFSDAFRNRSSFRGDFNEILADIYEAYQQELLASNAMDFGDLLCNVVTLFSLEKDILKHYQQQFRYVMVDEYQDTNKVQYMLIKLLGGMHRNVCVVGDDDQSIYAFRGASVENILTFRKDFPEAEMITLEENYRSTRNILLAANAVISKNTRRQEKKMRTANPHGEEIVLCRTTDERSEANFVATEAERSIKNGVSPADIAVFYRTNAQSRAIEEAFCELGLPYEIYGGHRFYDRKEIKDIMAYYRLLLNPADNEAFLRIINTPARGLGRQAINALLDFSSRESKPLFESLHSLLQTPSPQLSSLAKKGFSAFVSLFQELEEEKLAQLKLLSGECKDAPAEESSYAIANLLKTIGERTGYIGHLEAENTPESQSRIENIVELYNVAVEFVRLQFEQGVRPTFHDFLDRTSLVSDLDKENTKRSEQKSRFERKDSISLMTLHLAKGLEFDLVFIVGLEEGLLPHSRSLSDISAVEEERRLCYVGITRARRKLHLSCAEERTMFGRSSWCSGQPSRFLVDIPEALLEFRSHSISSKRAFAYGNI